ncbi:MAG: hypothetical protein ACLSHX_14550 [Suilimivivens sp.]
MLPVILKLFRPILGAVELEKTRLDCPGVFGGDRWIPVIIDGSGESPKDIYR